jgi:DNA mismatch repair ATPase MutL
MLKNITLSAEESLIAEARRRAALRNTTLNQLFREWLAEIAGEPGEDEQQRIRREYDDLMERLSYVRAGRKFTRDEMNERR